MNEQRQMCIIVMVLLSSLAVAGCGDDNSSAEPTSDGTDPSQGSDTIEDTESDTTESNDTSTLADTETDSAPTGTDDTETDSDTERDSDSAPDTDAPTDTTAEDTATACEDDDSDGWCSQIDCDDSKADVNPDQDEQADNLVDDDCDGLTDEASACVPVSDTETVCDGKDDDCNGRVDDVDIGGDGLCDCLRIGVMGGPGGNPSANFQAWLEDRGTFVERFHTEANPVALTLTKLEEFDVIILDRLSREYDTTEAQLLADWVGSGGGVMAMTGHTAAAISWDRPNSLLATIGLAYEGGPLRNGPVTDFATHPITEGLTSVTFLGGWAVDEINTSGTNTVVATLPSSTDSAGTVQERGRGRAFVWGDEWIEFDSEWTTLPEIEQFWINIMSWLGPRDSCQIFVE